MDRATAAPADPPDEPPVADPPPIGVASIPVSGDQTRPPAPVPSMPVPEDPPPLPPPAPPPVRLTPVRTTPGRPADARPAPADDRTAAAATESAADTIETLAARAAATETAAKATVPGSPDPAHAMAGFAPGVSAKLQSYVYLLVDPRTGRAFYVGRGRDDRCFRHVRAARLGSDLDPDAAPAEDAKYPMLERIREVESGGREVRIDILRYGLSPDEALLVEAAAHDALGLQAEPKLGSQRQSAVEVGALLTKRAKFKRVHQVVLLRVGGIGADPTYEVARHGWRLGRNWINPDAVRSPKWAVIVVGNLVAAVHRIDQWQPTPPQAPTQAQTGAPGWVAGTAPDRGSAPEGPSGGRSGRYSFAGAHDPELERRYVGKSVAAYLGTGPPSPVTYVWCGPHWVNTPP